MNNGIRQRGMTLVEIMIGITISLLLLAGVMQIYVSNKQTYRVQDALSGLQDSGRFAVKTLTEEIRSADFWGCKGSIDQVTNHLNASASNPFNFSLGGVSGSNDTGLNGSDTLVLQGATNSGLRIETHGETGAAANFLVSDQNHGLNIGDFMLATDCTKSDLLQVTNSQPGTNKTVVGQTGNGTPGNATKPGLKYEDDEGFLFKTTQVTYSLQAGANGEPALFRTENNGTAQELVEGVENMQFTYGEDTNGDGVADRYLDAGASGLVMARVVSVRVDLILRTTEDNISSVTNNGDKRLRRNFSATTVIRNRAS